MSKEKKLRTLRIKRLDKKPTVKNILEPQDKIRMVKIFNLKSFYDKYLVELNLMPDSYIKTVSEHILLSWYYKNSAFTDCNTRIKMIENELSQVDIPKFLSIYITESIDKLKYLNVYELMNDCIYKLYEVLFYILDIKGSEYIPYKIKGKIERIEDIRKLVIHKSMSFNKYGFTKVNRKFIMDSNNRIINLDTDIEPNSSLSNSIIFIEYYNNRFISVPYSYYRKLYNIDRLSLSLEIVDVAYCEPEFPMGFPICRFEIAANTIENIIEIAMDYDCITQGLSMISRDGGEHMYDIINDNVIIYLKNGKVKNINFYEFKNKYLSFLD